MRISDWSADVCSSDLVRYARGVSLTLSARKILALMMHQAAGDAWRDQEHRIAKRMLRGSHNSNDRLTDTIDELMGIFFAISDKENGRASCRERGGQNV